MNKGITALGCFFIAISAFLYASKHIVAALISTNINTPEINYYEGSLELIGFGMTLWPLLSLLIGIIVILIGVWPALKGALQMDSPKINMNKSR